jgi:hypothetical protein
MPALLLPLPPQVLLLLLLLLPLGFHPGSCLRRRSLRVV